MTTPEATTPESTTAKSTPAEEAAPEEAAPEESAEGEAPGRRARMLAVGPPLLLATVLVGLLATSAWFWYDARRGDDGKAAALTAGRSAAVLFFSLDQNHVRANVDQLLARSTGSFKKEYAAQRGRLESQVRAKQLTVTASVANNGTALEFLSPVRAQVLVAVDTTTRIPGGHSEKSAYRTRVVLSRVGDRWLVSGLEQVG